jgi:hypothetical protein
MSTIDPAALKAAHSGHSSSSLRPGGCSVNPGGRETPTDRCQRYLLADALLTERAKVALDVELREMLWRIVSRTMGSGEAMDVWTVRGLLQHRDEHDADPTLTCGVTHADPE